MRILFVIDEMTAITRAARAADPADGADRKGSRIRHSIGVLRGSDWLRSATGGIGVTVLTYSRSSGRRAMPNTEESFGGSKKKIHLVNLTSGTAHYHSPDCLAGARPTIISTRRNLNHSPRHWNSWCSAPQTCLRRGSCKL